MDLELRDRVAIVTAASRGLGRAVALALAGEGCNIVLCARAPDALGDVEKEVRALGVEVRALALDVASPTASSELVNAALTTFGRLDILIGNIGGPPSGDAFTFEPGQINLAVETGILSQVRLVLAAAPVMRASGWGRICLIASTGVHEPLPGHSLSAFRAGLWGWAKSISHDLIKDGVTINMTCPGMHRTDRLLEPGFSPDGEVGSRSHAIGDPADFGGFVAFLCSERARWINGVAVNVDGGTTLAFL